MLGWLLWAVTALLAVLGVAAVAGGITGHGGGGSGAAGFVFAAALLAGSGARSTARGGAAVSRAFGPGVPPSGAPALADPLPAASAGVSYRERGSQFPVLGALIGACLVAGSVAGLAAAGGPNGRGPGAGLSLLVLVTFVGTVYLILVLLDLANGIEISDGRFAVGALGVPPGGRLWRRISGPLAAVRSWEVLTSDQVRDLGTGRRAEARSGRRRLHLGDLRLFGRRRVLRLVVDPAATAARLPSRVQDGYVLVSASRAGGIWDGCIMIGTRRPAALTAALERALPGRRGRG